MNAQPQNLLEARDLSKSYGRRKILLPLSFQLQPGECLGLSGANGCGKSTLLKLLAQAQKPDGGDVLFRGRSVLGDRKFLRQQLGYVPQDNELAEDLTVRRQIALWQAACGRRGDLPQSVTELLGIDELLPYRIGELSGGMQRRVSIALALSGAPAVVIADEATNGLDLRYREALLDWMEAFLQRGGCAVWCSHRQEEFRRICGRCAYLQDGHMRWGCFAEQPADTQK